MGRKANQDKPKKASPSTAAKSRPTSRRRQTGVVSQAAEGRAEAEEAESQAPESLFKEAEGRAERLAEEAQSLAAQRRAEETERLAAERRADSSWHGINHLYVYNLDLHLWGSDAWQFPPRFPGFPGDCQFDVKAPEDVDISVVKMVIYVGMSPAGRDRIGI